MKVTPPRYCRSFHACFAGPLWKVFRTNCLRLGMSQMCHKQTDAPSFCGVVLAASFSAVTAAARAQPSNSSSANQLGIVR